MTKIKVKHLLFGLLAICSLTIYFYYAISSRTEVDETKGDKIYDNFFREDDRDDIRVASNRDPEAVIDVEYDPQVRDHLGGRNEVESEADDDYDYFDLVSHDPYELPSTPSLPNRTAAAGNQNILVFYRVPKTGSQVLQELAKILGKLSGFKTFVDPASMTYFPTKKQKEKFAGNFRSRLESESETGIYLRHFPYFNWTAHGVRKVPIQASMVRHPIERVISWFYYVRWHDRPDEKVPQFCNKTEALQRFCADLYRNRDVEKRVYSRDVDFEQCFNRRMPECRYDRGHGGWKDWTVTADFVNGEDIHWLKRDMYNDYRNQIVFFCGNHPDCIAFNTQIALNIAKRNTDENFSAVGLIEDLEGSLEVFEALMPKFFSGAKSLFEFQRDRGKALKTNRNPNKKSVPRDIRLQLERSFDKELEFYEFCKQRLERQKKQISADAAKRAKLKEFLYQDMERYVEEFESDDYVLL